MEDRVEKFRPLFHIRKDLYRCLVAEFFCTGLLVFGGTSTSAQFVLSKGQQDAWINVNIGWGFSLIMAVYAGFSISGSHLNPAVSLFLYTMGRLSRKRCILYSLVQILGGFCGSFFTWILYYDALNAYDGGTRHVGGANGTGGIFCTYPQDFLGIGGGIADQVIGTAYLCICVSIITDRRNRIPVHLQPLLIGFVVIQIGICAGMNGYAINTARDLGPRLFTLCAGWGRETFSYNDYKWFWIPTLCPLVGGVLGAWIYQFFLGFHLVDEDDAVSENIKKVIIEQIQMLKEQVRMSPLKSSLKYKTELKDKVQDEKQHRTLESPQATDV